MGNYWEKNFGRSVVLKISKRQRTAFEKLLNKGYVRYDDLPLETKNGREIAVEFISTIYLVNHHKVIQCNIRDITDRETHGGDCRRKFTAERNNERWSAGKPQG